MLPFPHLIFLQVDRHTKPKQENMTNWLHDNRFISCWLLVIMWKTWLMRKHIHPATPCILHNHMLESSCFFPPLFILLSPAFAPWWGHTRHWLLDSLRPRRHFQSGVQAHLQQYHALTALPPAPPAALTSIASARSTCVHIFAAKILPSMGHFHSLLTVRVCLSGIINWQCVSPGDCWILTQGETPLGCQAVNCTQRRILRGYRKRIIVLCFPSPKKPSSSLILHRSGMKNNRWAW